jgi:hypothetical protein
MPVQHSTGWKTVTLQIAGSDESLDIPVMIAAKIADIRNTLAKQFDIDDPSTLQFHCRSGCSWKRMRLGDESQKKLVVRGIKTFAKQLQSYAHPIAVIGCGHFGLRQGMHLERTKRHDYLIFDRKPILGGNAWATIGNHQSKLQSEGAQYQLQYDWHEGEAGMYFDYGYWPSRQQIINHFYQVTKQWGVFPHIHLSTEVTDTCVCPDLHDLDKHSYEISTKKTDESGEKSVAKFSAITHYPGCLCVPHRKTWPGEDIFGGQIAYGFSNEFEYWRVEQEEVILIGMGAFAAENVRTLMEYGASKIWLICRHFNLLLPRCISWYINQSETPPPAAFILDAFVPMYKQCGWDPWEFFSITSNADRTVASIKQYTRWGIGDATFLAVTYGLCQIINGEVKRFKNRAAVLLNGRVIENLDHFVKVIGFDGDFGVDRVLHASWYEGYWPEADFRKWCMSDQSAIDASRFGGTALSPYANSFTYTSVWYFEHPKIAKHLAKSETLPKGYADVELGSPGYHFEPRKGTTVTLIYSSYHQELQEFEGHNSSFKKRSLWHMCPPEKFVEQCESDWYQYCEMLQARGDNRPFPK